jgi:hypothetical protein
MPPKNEVIPIREGRSVLPNPYNIATGNVPYVEVNIEPNSKHVTRKILEDDASSVSSTKPMIISIGSLKHNTKEKTTIEAIRLWISVWLSFILTLEKSFSAMSLL